MDILKRACMRSSPKIVALQIKKNAPKNHPKTKKYLKLLSRFGTQWLSYEQIPDNEKVTAQEMLRLAAAARVAQGVSPVKNKGHIQITKNLIRLELEKTRPDWTRIREYQDQLNMLENFKKREFIPGIKGFSPVTGDISMDEFQRRMERLHSPQSFVPESPLISARPGVASAFTYIQHPNKSRRLAFGF